MVVLFMFVVSPLLTSCYMCPDLVCLLILLLFDWRSTPGSGRAREQVVVDTFIDDSNDLAAVLVLLVFLVVSF